jgi:hypothetical protein
MWKRRLLTGALAALVCLAPPAASADGFFAPFYGKVGEAPGTEAGRSDPEAFGVSFGWMNNGVFGVETDISFAPDFFGDSDDLLIGSNSVTTFMGNAILGIPLGGKTGFSVRPYVVGGFGGVRQRVEDFGSLIGFSNVSWGYDVGGGAFVYFTRNFGVRGDYRYFKSTFDAEDLLGIIGIDPDGDEVDVDFKRYTIAVSLRW